MKHPFATQALSFEHCRLSRVASASVIGEAVTSVAVASRMAWRRFMMLEEHQYACCDCVVCGVPKVVANDTVMLERATLSRLIYIHCHSNRYSAWLRIRCCSFEAKATRGSER